MSDTYRPPARRQGLPGLVDRMISRLIGATAVVAVPVSVLLFLQWPLREWVQAYSREANDVAQILFAIYVSVAITAATRYRTHLAADAIARRYPPAVKRWLARLSSLLLSIPWSLFVVWAASPSVAQSVRQLERFPETFNPGYFLLKIALLVLALLTLLQGVLDVLDPVESPFE